jgi:GT2 family glycosyltransferase
MNNPPLVGVCILTYNSERVVAACIQSLKEALNCVPHEIVVVDNHSSDNSVAFAEQQYGLSNMRTIRSPINTGYSRGNNIGASYLLERGCDYLVFVNPDVTVRPDTLAQMQVALSNNQDAGCVGGVAIIGGHPSKACFRTKPTFTEKFWLYSSARYFPVLHNWLRGITESMEIRHLLPIPSSVQPVYAVSGACIMFPSDVFAEIGGFDENTFLFQEEFIISERLLRTGRKVYGCPGAVYDHVLGHSVGVRPLRSYLFLIKSEQHLTRAYYNWSVSKRALMTAVRYADFAIGATITGARRLWRDLRG